MQFGYKKNLRLVNKLFIYLLFMHIPDSGICMNDDDNVMKLIYVYMHYNYYAVDGNNHPIIKQYRKKKMN